MEFNLDFDSDQHIQSTVAELFILQGQIIFLVFY
jgi:hypothetical protein